MTPIASKPEEMTIKPMNPPNTEKPKRGLGRGLDALFAEGEQRVSEQGRGMREGEEVGAETSPIPTSSFPVPSAAQPPRTLLVAALIPTPFQPRKRFDDAELQALAESIRAHGVLQPLLVRPSPAQNGKYEIIAGERRWRASQLAQLHEVPVVVQQLDDRATLEIALIENIQRADLTPIEEAMGYQRLMDEFQHTQEALAKAVGKSRPHIANMLRLLGLPDEVQTMLTDGKISAGHARILVGMANATALAEEAAKKNMSVRELEQHVAKIKRPQKSPFTKMSIQEMNDRRMAKAGGAFPGIDHPYPKDADVIALEHEMGNLLGLRVEIHSMADRSGVLGIHYASLDQLDDLLERLAKAGKQ